MSVHSELEIKIEETIAEKIELAMVKIKHWIITSVVSLVIASGGSALTFYISVNQAMETAKRNEVRLNSRSSFIGLTKAQISQVEAELQKINPDFKLVSTVVLYE